MNAPAHKTYLRGLNALRFYAALSVIIQHIPFVPSDWLGSVRADNLPARFFLNGTDSVNMFFVLSGFLITWLLLNERAQTGAISLRNFYLRRIFRIFPVYFLYLGVCVLLIQSYRPELIALLAVFAGNVAYVLFYPFPPLEHLWSIGVEEGYYLFAPAIARRFRNFHRVYIGFIVCWWLLLLLSVVVPPNFFTEFVRLSRYDLIAVGGLLAFAYYFQWPIVRLLLNRFTLIASLALAAYAVIFVESTSDPFYTTAVAFAFAVIIFNVAAAERLPGWMTNRRIEYLGNLSYSMYVYHPLLILLFYTLFQSTLPLPVYSAVIAPVIIGLTLLISSLSYRLWEKPFLRAKERFRQPQEARAKLTG